MPEGPELFLSAKYINEVCLNKVFSGQTELSNVAKGPPVCIQNSVHLTAQSRGKELKLSFQDAENSKNVLSVIFHFGMSGQFKLTRSNEIPKHSHFRVSSVNPPDLILNFVDTRRFGKWKVQEEWTFERGPDPITEYELFRKNVLTNLEDTFFSKPICEVLLSPKYFNGIGNYLRAEILYRLSIPPFDPAIDVLSPLNIESTTQDILALCHEVPLEVIKLEKSKYFDDEDGKSDQDIFNEWLQCYNNPKMKSRKDHNKRTIWFAGIPGKLCPGGSTVTKARVVRTKISKMSVDGDPLKTNRGNMKRRVT